MWTLFFLSLVGLSLAVPVPETMPVLSLDDKVDQIIVKLDAIQALLSEERACPDNAISDQARRDKPPVDVMPEPEQQPDTLPEKQPETVPEVQPQPETLPEVQPQPETLPEKQPQPETLPEVQPQPETLPEVQPQPETLPEQQPQPETLPEQQPQPETLSEKQPQPETLPEQQPQPETLPEQQPQPETQPESEAQPETQPVVDPMPENAPAVPKQETQPAAGGDSGSDAGYSSSEEEKEEESCGHATSVLLDNTFDLGLGEWAVKECCPPGSYVTSISSHIEVVDGHIDSLYGTRQTCSPSLSIISSVNYSTTSGITTSVACTSGSYIAAFSVVSVNPADPRSLVSEMAFGCRSPTSDDIVPTTGGSIQHPTWQVECPAGNALCGVQNRVAEPGQAQELQGIRLFCCAF